jgi:hypothetical protein
MEFERKYTAILSDLLEELTPISESVSMEINYSMKNV